MQPIHGIHHITALASNPQTNVDFYQQVLGQRLVKTTVNFDDPSTYHLYYGDETGTPGTIITFFPWRGLKRGWRGSGEVGAIAYAIAPESLGFWRTHLSRMNVRAEEIEDRFGSSGLRFVDPDGMPLELIATPQPAAIKHWQAGPIPAEHALRGFHSVTLWVNYAAATADLLTTQFGYVPGEQSDNRTRFIAPSHAAGTIVDLLEDPALPRGSMGAGTVHHVAFRVPDDPTQLAYQAALTETRLHVTTVLDRQYFRSIYFREPNGVLFELATDPPGFTIDETVAELGATLKLPPWLESQRSMIAQFLPPLKRHTAVHTEIQEQRS